jgi:hypothetical protein
VTDKKMPIHGFANCVNGIAVDGRLVSAVEAHRDRIAGRAMWSDNRFNRLFFSDALVAALQASVVEGVELSPQVAET